MIYFTDEMIDRLIKEDVPYLVLTTASLGIGSKRGIIQFHVREPGIVACTEEAAKILKKLEINVDTFGARGINLFHQGGSFGQ